MWYSVLYTACVLFLNLIHTVWHFNLNTTSSGLPIHHQTGVWCFNGLINRRGGLDVVRNRFTTTWEECEARLKKSASFTRKVQLISLAIGILVYVKIMIAMEGYLWFLVLIAVVFVFFALSVWIDFLFNSILSWRERLAVFANTQPNNTMICPHCQKTGFVSTRTVKRKKGLSGSKTAMAVITGGLSVLGTGLSRKEKETEAYCSNCRSKWHF